MDARRQTIQLQLAFSEDGRGEAPRASEEGAEASRATRDAESQVWDEGWMEAVVEQENVRAALERVCANRGAPGVDGMRTQELVDYLSRHWTRIREELLAGTYKPLPVKRVEIPKPGGGVRKLGIPTVLDRFIQQALLQVLQKEWDRTFSAHSFGFRPGRSAHQAVAQAQQYVSEGHSYVVDIDLEKFFDRVNHDMLMGRISKRVGDKRVLRVLRAFLNAGVLEDGLVSSTTKGTPQGGPLSPLLSNVMLDDLDKELEARGHRFVRYADDCNIYVRSERAGERVLASITDFLTRKLRLKVNAEKSAVGRPWDRTFLGFSFSKGSKPKRRIGRPARQRFKDRVRKLTSHKRGKSLARLVRELRRYLLGWRGYFGFCETPSVLRRLDGWIRRRLRYVVWRQLGTGKRRRAELRRRGVSALDAWAAAGSPSGPWRLSSSRALHNAFPKAYFSSLGLPSLDATLTP